MSNGKNAFAMRANPLNSQRSLVRRQGFNDFVLGNSFDAQYDTCKAEAHMPDKL